MGKSASCFRGIWSFSETKKTCLLKPLQVDDALQGELPDHVASWDISIANKGVPSHRQLSRAAGTMSSTHRPLNAETKELDILA